MNYVKHANLALFSSSLIVFRLMNFIDKKTIDKEFDILYNGVR